MQKWTTESTHNISGLLKKFGCVLILYGNTSKCFLGILLLVVLQSLVTFY